MMKLAGGYKPLTEWPISVTLPVLLTILAIMPIGRSLLEGFSYNLCFSTAFGDPVGLAGAVLVVISILQYKKGDVYLPRSLKNGLQSGKVHFVLMLISLSAGMVFHLLTSNSRPVTLMDGYHDFLVVPLFVYFGMTLIPIIFYNGTWMEKGRFIGFVVIWFVFVFLDRHNALTSQHQWIQHTYYFIRYVR